MSEITMDAVRDLIERHSDHISGNTREFYNGAYAEIADELTAERAKLKSQICKLEDDLVRANDERDNWKANCEDWKKHARAAENACYETMLEREAYHEKFGKCLDYADAIHALMDDEGMS